MREVNRIYAGEKKIFKTFDAHITEPSFMHQLMPITWSIFKLMVEIFQIIAKCLIHNKI